MISINSFFSLKKGFYPYECMDEWENFNKKLFPGKEEFYRNLGEYQHLYLKSGTLLLADVLKSFRKMCLKIYHFHRVKFL